jgi:acyl carrier protein
MCESDGRVSATCRITRVFRELRNASRGRGVLSDGARGGAEVKLMTSGIESQITALIAVTLHVDEAMVGRNAAFTADLGADSLAIVALILAIEDEFQIDIHDEDAAEILTVEQMIEYVSFARAVKEPTVTSRLSSDRLVGLR